MQLLLVHTRLFNILSMSGREPNRIPIVIIPAINNKHNTLKISVNFLKILCYLLNEVN